MFKTLITLVRGRTVAIAEEVADQHALVILDQQMRDATGALDRAKKALAIAIAQEDQEGRRLETTRARIEDLEARAVAAIEAGRDDLATEAAEAIATLEAERDASATARALFTAEIAKLKGHLLQQQVRSRSSNAVGGSHARQRQSGLPAAAASRPPRFSKAHSWRPRQRFPACESAKSRPRPPRQRLMRLTQPPARSPLPRSSRPRASAHA